LALTCSRTTNAAMARIVFELAIPNRNTRSKSEPIRMYGFRRPQRVMV